MLVVEADATERTAACRALEAAGYRPVAVRSVAAGRQELQTSRHGAIRVVLFGVGPGAGGVAAFPQGLVELLSAPDGRTILLMAAPPLRRQLARALDLSKADIVCKPIDAHELLGAVRRAAAAATRPPKQEGSR